ncbi:hypothetical protein [Brunnivagina elsteri]|nr:hypothetical protein [Calothrix elsteri]
MRQFLKSVVTMTAVYAIASVPILLKTDSAKADEGMRGSYVGIGVSVSVEQCLFLIPMYKVVRNKFF